MKRPSCSSASESGSCSDGAGGSDSSCAPGVLKSYFFKTSLSPVNLPFLNLQCERSNGNGELGEHLIRNTVACTPTPNTGIPNLGRLFQLTLQAMDASVAAYSFPLIDSEKPLILTKPWFAG